MKYIIHLKRYLIIIATFLAVILLTGCEVGVIKARKPAGDLSRGLPLPIESSSSPAAAVDPEGKLIQVIVPTERGEEGKSFRYFQINEEARIVLDQDLDLDLGVFTRSLKMASSEDHNHIIWASRENTTDGWQLWHAILNSKAEIISNPKWISQGTNRVSQYEIAEDGVGGVLILWEDSNASSISFTHLSAQGVVLDPPSLLIPFGERPSLIADSQGGYHLVWMVGENLLYSSLERDFSYPILGEQVARLQVSRGNRLEGPVVGTSGSHVNIFWSILRLVGLEAGTAITESVDFPAGQTNLAKRGLVTAYSASDDLFRTYEGSLSLSQIVPPPREDYLSTSYIYDPRTSLGYDGAQVVAVAADQSIRLDQYIQILIGVYEDGEYQGYTVGTRTTEISGDPLIFLDKNKNLHLIWQEGSSGNRVFYATTAPEARANLDRISMGDMPNLILAGGLEAVTGILLFPFAFPWMIVGLAIMIVLRLVRNDENVSQPLSIFLLIIAFLSFQGSKLLFLPDILVYVPFSAWLDIADGVGMFLRFAVPIIIFILAILVAEYRRRRITSPTSSLSYFFTIILLDTLLTLSVYGVIFLGEY